MITWVKNNPMWFVLIMSSIAPVSAYLFGAVAHIIDGTPMSVATTALVDCLDWTVAMFMGALLYRAIIGMKEKNAN